MLASCSAFVPNSHPKEGRACYEDFSKCSLPLRLMRRFGFKIVLNESCKAFGVDVVVHGLQNLDRMPMAPIETNDLPV